MVSAISSICENYFDKASCLQINIKSSIDARTIDLEPWYCMAIQQAIHFIVWYLGNVMVGRILISTPLTFCMLLEAIMKDNTMFVVIKRQASEAWKDLETLKKISLYLIFIQHSVNASRYKTLRHVRGLIKKCRHCCCCNRPDVRRAVSLDTDWPWSCYVITFSHTSDVE